MTKEIELIRKRARFLLLTGAAIVVAHMVMIFLCTMHATRYWAQGNLELVALNALYTVLSLGGGIWILCRMRSLRKTVRKLKELEVEQRDALKLLFGDRAPTTPMKKPSIREAIAAWHETAAAYGLFGADDTEPRNVFAQRVIEFAKDTSQDIPELEADEWSLYTKSRDCTAAADALNERLAAVCLAVKESGDLCGVTYDDLCYGG